MIKNLIKNLMPNKSIEIIRFIKNTSFRKETGKKKKYPKVIQLPLTYACNSKCVMCNIWKMDSSNEMGIEEFKKYINDPLFKDVVAVGINGGEPSLIKNLPFYAKEICGLPSIKYLNIISHGFNSRVLKEVLVEIYSICKSHDVNFQVSISLDGVGKIHNDVRGLDVFKNTFPLKQELKENKNKYCDDFNIGCTIIKQNVNHLVELDTFMIHNQLQNKIKYRLGIDNKRIESQTIRDQYSVIYDSTNYSPYKQAAKEFLLGRIRISNNINDKFKYFSMFYWLNSDIPKRLLGCSWKEEGVTMDARGKLFYCSVASDEIGSLRNIKKGEEIFFSDENIKHREDILKNKCDNCIHDYGGEVYIKNIFPFLKFMVLNKFSMSYYKFLNKLK